MLVIKSCLASDFSVTIALFEGEMLNISTFLILTLLIAASFAPPHLFPELGSELQWPCDAKTWLPGPPPSPWLVYLFAPNYEVCCQAAGSPIVLTLLLLLLLKFLPIKRIRV